MHTPDKPNYFHCDLSGEGAVLPSALMSLPELRERIKETLKAYISPRHNIAVDKIAMELEITCLLFHCSNTPELDIPQLKIYKPPPNLDDGGWGE